MLHHSDCKRLAHTPATVTVTVYSLSPPAGRWSTWACLCFFTTENSLQEGAELRTCTCFMDHKLRLSFSPPPPQTSGSPIRCHGFLQVFHWIHTLMIDVIARPGVPALVATQSIKSRESAVKLLARNNNDCAASSTVECWRKGTRWLHSAHLRAQVDVTHMMDRQRKPRDLHHGSLFFFSAYCCSDYTSLSICLSLFSISGIFTRLTWASQRDSWIRRADFHRCFMRPN